MNPSFDKFRTPDVVSIDIEGAKYEIMLPTRWNKPYQREWQLFTSNNAKLVNGSLQFENVTPVDLQEAQRNAFVKHCIKSGPIVGDQLINEYGPLLDILYEHCSEKATKLEEVVDDTVGKLQPSSNGATAGKVKLTSTPNLNSKDVSQKRTESHLS